ncbi:MAG: Dps family protein [Candidatus Woesearchaeota archaeon]
MNIGLSEKETNNVAEALHIVLANQHVLYQKLRNYHWNVKGKHFMTLHELFEEHYNELSNDIDEIAERIRSLGHYARGTMTEYIKMATLTEMPGEYPDEEGMITELLSDYEAIIVHLRKTSDVCAENNDKGSEDMIIGIMQKHEKQSWMIRSILNA